MSKQTHRKYKFKGKAFTTYVALSFLFASVFVVLVYFGFNNQIRRYTNIINTVAIKESNKEKKVSFDSKKKKLTSIPAYGSKYGNIKIEKIGLDLPLYFGDNEEILSYGVGHYAGSYFPGEGGSIIIAGHNDPGYFEKILDLVKKDKIVLDLTYGKFEYEVFDVKVVDENDLSAFPISDEKEMLILYTCYPLGVGHKTERFVVYAYRAGDSDA